MTTDWTYGTERVFLEELIRYWRQEYHWPDRVAALNQLPHARATIDGYGLHFLHHRGSGAPPVPLS